MKRLLVLSGICLTMLIGLVVMPLSATPVFAGSATSDICNGVGATSGGGNCSGGGGPSLGKVVKDVIDIFSIIVGITSVIMVIVGGFQYITSQGDSGKISGAKNTIMYALIGLVIVAFSQALVQLVLNKVGV
jgi:cytochrome bd-type quinol oxidase subunit 2